MLIYCRGRNVQDVLLVIGHWVPSKGEDPGLEKDVAWGRFDAETGRVGSEMDQDLVMAEVGRNDETDMDLERGREWRYGHCAVYTEVFLENIGVVCL